MQLILILTTYKGRTKVSSANNSGKAHDSPLVPLESAVEPGSCVCNKDKHRSSRLSQRMVGMSMVTEHKQTANNSLVSFIHCTDIDSICMLRTVSYSPLNSVSNMQVCAHCFLNYKIWNYIQDDEQNCKACSSSSSDFNKCALYDNMSLTYISTWSFAVGDNSASGEGDPSNFLWIFSSVVKQKFRKVCHVFKNF